RHRRGGSAHGRRVRRAAAPRAPGPDPAGLRLLRDPRGVRLHGAHRPRRLGGRDILPGAPRPARPAGVDRPEPAQRQRVVPGGGSPVRGHRWPHRRHGGQAGRREGTRLPSPHLDLRGRRPGRRRDPGGGVMPDVLSLITSSPVVKTIGKQLGLPQPATLRRGRALPPGDVVLGTLGETRGVVADTLRILGVPTVEALRDDPSARTLDEEGRARPPAYDARVGAVVVDATAVTTLGDLEGVRAILRPAVRALAGTG